jgi:hypothetical protein
MATPPGLLAALGNWRGTSKLNYSEDPLVENISESDSTLAIETDPLHAFATVSYTWAFEGQAHEGRVLLCGTESTDEVTAGWSDSWHQNGSAMCLSGPGMHSNQVRLTGSYGAAGGPDWGWRIEFNLEGDNLTLKMINITPEGDQTWAVHAEYLRA